MISKLSNGNLGNLGTQKLLNNIQNPTADLQNISNKNQIAKNDSIKDINTNKTNTKMDNVSINSQVVEEVEAEIIEKPKFEWKYNTTENGELPEFQLGQWEKTSSALFSNNTMVVGDKTFAVYLPQSLQDKMSQDPNFANSINSKLEEFFASSSKNGGVLEDGTSYSVISQHMAIAMDESGNISHSYVRTETFSITKNNPNQDGKNGDIATLDLNPTEEKTGIKASISVSYGFSIYQQNSISNSDNDNSGNTKPQNMIHYGMRTEITFETVSYKDFEPTTEIRKANGDIIELETGRIIQKNSDSQNQDIKKYNATA